MNELEFYSSQSLVSDPGEMGKLFDVLPTDIKKLCDIVHGLIIHRDDTKNLYGFNPPGERKDEPQTRYGRKILEKIMAMDNSPLEKTRKPETRFIGVCRDFSLLLCSILRYKKIPARLRCGFASYWELGLFWDHWVCEYYDKAKNRWVLADAEVGEEERKFYKISLDYTDISRDQFFVPGKAWRKCRKGKIAPDIFGVHVLENVKGWWFIRGNLLRDTAALNKEELLAWDYPKFYDKPDIKSPADLSKEEITLLDKLAELTGGETIKFGETLSLYRQNRDLQIGEKVTSYTADGPKIIKLEH